MCARAHAHTDAHTQTHKYTILGKGKLRDRIDHGPEE